MLKYCLFLGLSFCVAAAAAPIERLRLELPETSDAGLRQSAGVFLRRMKARVPPRRRLSPPLRRQENCW